MRKIQLSDHFTPSRILLFSLPCIIMQLVDNTYVIADGYFISNWIGERAFAAENLIYPPLQIIVAVGLMFGTGASALISKELGEGQREKANRLLSLITLTLAILGAALAAALYALSPSIARMAGASEEILPDCITYARVLSFFTPFGMLSIAFHSLLITAERPGLGLATSAVKAVVNIALDWLFVAKLGWGMRGAALASGAALLAGAVIPAVYFFHPKNPLHFVRPRMDLRELGKALYNGASEMVDGIAYALVALFMNLQLLKYMGEIGVSSSAVGDYYSALVSALNYGISMSIVPVVGYHLGKRDRGELRSLRRNGLMLLGGLDLATGVLSFVLAEPISRFFVGYDAELTAMAAHALRIISFSYPLIGLTTYSSSYFTGLNQGTASLVIAAVKGFAAPRLMIWLLPMIFGGDGIWISSTASEALALITAAGFFVWWKKKGEQEALSAPPEGAAEQTAG